MARPGRLEFSGAVYHVIARGNEGRPVFRDDDDREEYLSRIANYRERFGFRFLAYCLMTNHVHLAIRTGSTPLSRIMACLHSSYTQWFNRRHGRVGHLFQGRYKAFLVQEDRYFVALVRYVHLNPVQARVVDHASEYAWSSDRFFRTGYAPGWFDLDRALPSFGPTPRAAVRRYIGLIDGHPVQPTYEDLPAIDQLVKGDELFALAQFDAGGQLDPPLRGLSEDSVMAAVARVSGVTKEEMTGPRQGGSIAFARCLTAYVAKRLGRISARRLARRFHLDDSSLVRPMAALEATLATDVLLRELIDRIERAIREKERTEWTARTEDVRKSANHD
ncbi:MAG TPA: transposase [Thermoanaerobaculia bacterium]|nr:transposase [Thermoanaerobaculia bacterium]